MKAVLLLAGLLLGMTARATEGASSLDDLLAKTQAARAASSVLAAEREAQFNQAAPAEQERLLKDALAARAAAEATAKDLLDRYGAGEIRISDLHTRLKQQQAALGLAEVFGLARQAAGDAASIFDQSLITIQMAATENSPRGAFLQELASSKEVPSQADLERLWSELLLEMSASGKVARYQSKIVQPDGVAAAAEVIGVGPFTAISGSDYLAYQGQLQTLIRFARQPPADMRATAAGLASATTGYVPAVVDPTRGVLLSMYVERPTWLDRIEKGEEIGYVIIAVGLVAALLWSIQILYLVVVRFAVWRQLRNLSQPSRGNPLGRVLLAFKGKPERIEEDADIAELRISEAVMREVPKLERFQAFLRLAVAAGPLLGLIGTVVGMILTFQAITESGSSDPKLMADGIGQAMIATVLGLGIAIPLLFANAMLATLSRAVVQILDEQSAGLLAESLEQRQRA